LSELFGCSVSEATLYTAGQWCYGALEPVEAQTKTALLAEAVLNNDESGLNLAGENWWLHVTSSPSLTYYSVQPKRGKVALNAMGILGQYEGISVHDGLSSYQTYACQHALCNAHHLRELTFVQEQLGQTWAGDMGDLLRQIKKAVETAQADGQTALTNRELQEFELAYHKLLLVGLAANPPPDPSLSKTGKGRKKQSKAKNLLDRLHQHSQQVLRFMHDFRVPFDNNLAERDLRMLKVQQKISGGFRSQEGARMFCRIRGYLSSIRKQGHNPLYALATVFFGQTLLPALPK
jgi:transposase